MDMQGSRQLAITQQQAWNALNDPQILKACIVGCDKVGPIGADPASPQYAIGMGIKIGPVSAKFAGKILLSDIVAPASYKINFEGQGGAAGFGKGDATVTLVPNGKGCELAYTVHASVGGKIAQLGQRLIDGVAKSMAEDFFKRFDEAMQVRHPEAYAVQAQADAAEAAQAGGGSATQGTESSDGIPKWVWFGIVAVVAAAYFALRK